MFILVSAAPVVARTVTLSWDANSEPDLDHYVVYWGTASGNYTVNSIDNGDDIGLGTEYSVEIPDDGQVYYFAVTAVDDSGLESDYSTEVNTDDAFTIDANAGPDQTVNEGVLVNLDASGSINAVSYQWTQTGGTSVTINNATSAQASFTSPTYVNNGEILTFMLTVTDGDNNIDTDTCTVTINTAKPARPLNIRKK